MPDHHARTGKADRLLWVALPAFMAAEIVLLRGLFSSHPLVSPLPSFALAVAAAALGMAAVRLCDACLPPPESPLVSRK